MQVAAADCAGSHFDDDIVGFSDSRNRCIDNSNVLFPEPGESFHLCTRRVVLRLRVDVCAHISEILQSNKHGIEISADRKTVEVDVRFEKRWLRFAWCQIIE